MALRAWLSSKLKALIDTSSQTGSTATVERLLAGLVTSGLDATLGRPRAEPRERIHCFTLLCLTHRKGSASYSLFLRWCFFSRWTLLKHWMRCEWLMFGRTWERSTGLLEVPQNLLPQQMDQACHHLRVSSLNVVERSFWKLHQLSVSDCMDCGGTRLPSQSLHLRERETVQRS